MRNGPRRFAFALGTFHVCVLGLLGAVLAHLAGAIETLEDLGTLPGLALFGLLWCASIIGTRWALGGVYDHAFDIALRRGILGGALAGVVVLWALLLAGVASAFVMAAGDAEAGAIGGVLLYLALAATAGTAVASIVGGAVGFVLALLDWLILAAAGIADGWTPRDEVARR